MAYARIAPIGNVVTLVYDAVHAVAYGAYAIRPYNYHKPDIDYFSLNAPKTTSDMGKTMSHVGKIMSDIIQTTSGLFSFIGKQIITTIFFYKLFLLEINMVHSFDNFGSP